MKIAPPPAAPLAVATIDALLTHLVAHWHDFEVEHSEEGLRGRICDLHRFNFLLWHEEDIARSPHVTDGRIAQVKRAIDESQVDLDVTSVTLAVWALCHGATSIELDHAMSMVPDPEAGLEAAVRALLRGFAIGTV